jgi:hypothetical protein
VIRAAARRPGCDDAVVDATERDMGPAVQVVATQTRQLPLLRFQTAINALLFLGWGAQAVTDREAVHVLLTVLTGSTLGLYVWMLVGSPRVELVLGSESLVLRRRFRPLVVARCDVLAVRGDVHGRPTWSGQVLVQTRTRTVRLPTLDPGPGTVIPRLQEWAGVGEEPPSPVAR